MCWGNDLLQTQENLGIFPKEVASELRCIVDILSKEAGSIPVSKKEKNPYLGVKSGGSMQRPDGSCSVGMDWSEAKLEESRLWAGCSNPDRR